MGRRGPKPMPTMLSTQQSAAGGPGDPPPEVQASPVALDVWRRTTAALESVSLWHQADGSILARYCILSAMHRECQADVTRNGMTITTNSGYRAPSPAATTLLKLSTQLLAIEQSIGLTPRSRSRMKAPLTKAVDEFQTWLDEN